MERVGLIGSRTSKKDVWGGEAAAASIFPLFEQPQVNWEVFENWPPRPYTRV